MRKLELQKVDTTKQKDTACQASPKSVLEAFEYIVELSENSNLDKDFFDKASRHIKYASRKLHLTSKQVVLLAQFVDRSQNRRIMISDIAEYVGCRTTRFLRMAEDIDSLEAQYYLRASRSNDMVCYRVPAEVLKSICKNQPYVHVKENISDTQSFFDKFNLLMKEKENNELTHDNLCTLTLEMLDEIKQSQFARKIKSCLLHESDTILFIYMAHLFVENNDDNIGFHDLENLYDNDKMPPWIKRMFRNRTSDLFEQKLIENVNEDGMARSDSFKLTKYAKEEVLSELDLNNVGKSETGLIAHDSLAQKELIYNESEQNQISELSSILSKDRFNNVQSRLEKAGMRKGFCCLFYGAPGTGKTETAYQLARQTGRNIMRVDVDKIKSCWVGESEKNIKALFDRYRNICKNSTIAPILLFNEADAVLGVRMEGASRAVDKMENSIQNIILQEMENLEGILIATTNLTTNLDKAFERRFLYKIRFDRPSIGARAKIWQIMLSNLSSEDARLLATQFDLSGGEIENIARRQSVNAILSGDDSVNIEEIKKLCQQERINSVNKAKIGF